MICVDSVLTIWLYDSEKSCRPKIQHGCTIIAMSPLLVISEQLILIMALHSERRVNTMIGLDSTHNGTLI